MLRADELTKRYGSAVALDRLTLAVPEGAVLGLLGPKGAGKTTFLRLLMGFVFPDGGTLDRGGLLPSQIGYVPEGAPYPGQFRVRDYLQITGRLAGLRDGALRSAVGDLLWRLDLEPVAKRRLEACPRSVLMRVGLAQALLGDPDVLLLDEPAAGLEAAAERFMRDQLEALHEAGKTMVLAGHDLGELLQVCTHVAVLSHGRLVRIGSLDSVLPPQADITIRTGPMPVRVPSDLRALGPGILAADGRVRLVGAGVQYKAQVLRLLLEAGVEIRELAEKRVSLEVLLAEASEG